MRSLTDFVCASSVPPARSRVTPWTKTRQPVTESGTVNSIVAVPSAPVRRWGCQKAVSAKFVRSSVGCSPASMIVAGSGALSLSFDFSLGAASPFPTLMALMLGVLACRASSDITTPPNTPPTTPPAYRRPGPPMPYPPIERSMSGLKVR